jgi:hypothetical protein
LQFHLFHLLHHFHRFLLPANNSANIANSVSLKSNEAAEPVAVEEVVVVVISVRQIGQRGEENEFIPSCKIRFKHCVDEVCVNILIVQMMWYDHINKLSKDHLLEAGRDESSSFVNLGNCVEIMDSFNNFNEKRLKEWIN